MTLPFIVYLSAIAVRTFIILVVVVLGFRLLGKGELGQMNVYDLAMVMAVANAVQNAMTNGSGNLTVGITSATVLITVGWLTARLLFRRGSLRRRVIGVPTVLVSHGRIYHQRLAREHIPEEELRSALRQHGILTAQQARLVVLEVDGALSVIPEKRGKDSGASTIEDKDL
ncbi:MAG: DUF421 domain-containing protein [Armatimonadetes bacterium]|nr:DUF421 domain-containing protein [Armatimonadota bacterium]MDE2207529.1 DUF421 domain-containing protein [Armatimonadota bacterium]